MNAVYGTEVPDSDGRHPGIQRADLIQVFLTGVPGLNQPADVVAQRDAAPEHVDPAVLERLLAAGRASAATSPGSRTAAVCPTTSSTCRCAWSLGVLLPDHQAIADTIGDGVDANDVPFLRVVPVRGLPALGLGRGPALTHRRGPAASARPAPVTSGLRRTTATGRARGCERSDGSASRPRWPWRLFLAGAGRASCAAAPSRRRRPAPRPRPRACCAPGAAGSLEGTIAALQARLRVEPDDWQSCASLGPRVRAAGARHGRPELLPEGRGRAAPLARPSTRRTTSRRWWAWRRSPPPATTSPARSTGASARRPSTRTTRNVYGVIGDAQVELGRYDDGVRDVPEDGGHAAGPGVVRAGLVRARAPGRRRRRDPGDAQRGGRSPGRRTTAPGPRTSSASSTSTAGDSTARPRSTAAPPSSRPSSCRRRRASRRWRGPAATSQGAIARYTEVTQRYPSPEYVIALGDLYAAAGEPEQARQQYDLVRTIQALFAANGVNVDLELALFEADHGDAVAALRTARDEWDAPAHDPRGRRPRVGAARERPRPRGARDTAGRALVARHAQRAVLVPRRHDPARRSATATARGADLARALDTNPHFSIRYAPEAAPDAPVAGGPAVRRAAPRRSPSARSPPVVALWPAAAASAHPLGNFTVNHYAGLEAAPGELRVVYAIDIAEIPTQQLRAEQDTDGDGQVSAAELQAWADDTGARVAGDLHVSVDGAPLTLSLPVRHRRVPRRPGRPERHAVRGAADLADGRRAATSRSRTPPTPTGPAGGRSPRPASTGVR